MSHKDIGAPKVSGGKSYFLDCGKFDRGISFCEYDRELLSGQSPYMLNMIFENGMLRTRAGKKYIGTGIIPDGKLHSRSEEFCGSYVFHIGDGIYAFDGTDMRKLAGDVPDCGSFMISMNSELYIFFSAVRVFIVDKDFSAREYVIGETRLMHNVKFNLDGAVFDDVPDNMIMFRVCVEYQARDAGISRYTLPTECDSSYPVIFTNIQTGNVTEVDFTVSGNTVELKGGKELYVPYRISYVPAKGSEYRNFDKIFGCTAVCTYGGNSSDGTRVFFSGNKDYPGHYFYSEFLSPLHIKKLSYDVLGDGNEEITAFAKQKGELIAFGKKGIYRLRYTFGEDTGPDFIINEISTGIGCDMPGSIQLVDNRLVFASSRLGVYIIVSSEYTDELSIRRISANVNGVPMNGFLYEDGYEDCISVDFQRRYMLVFPSGNAYIWDYGNSPYVVSADPLASEKRLVWYLFDGMYESSLFEMYGRLYGTEEREGGIGFAVFSDDADTDFGQSIMCMYRSRTFDAKDSFAKKVASEFYINACGFEGTDIGVYFFADGYPALSESYTFRGRLEDGALMKRLLFCIPGFEAYRFYFVIAVMKGKAGLYDAGIRFSSAGIYYR